MTNIKDIFNEKKMEIAKKTGLLKVGDYPATMDMRIKRKAKR